MSVAVVFEGWSDRGGGRNPLSFEALAAGRRVAEILGTTVQVLEFDGSEGTAESFAAALEEWVRREQPEALVFPHSYQVRDYVPRVAARFQRSLISDVVGISGEGKTLRLVRLLFQGKLQAELRPSEGLVCLSVQAGAFRPEAWDGPVERLESRNANNEAEVPFRAIERTVDLSSAERIVAVGRGIRDEASLGVARDLAQALGAELAASRPVCDSGWLPIERQVGSSGQTVAPKCYFALGISGAIQHLVGMKGAQVTVAINQDPSAPIFEVADYGIVADLFAVTPAIIDELKKAKT